MGSSPPPVATRQSAGAASFTPPPPPTAPSANERSPGGQLPSPALAGARRCSRVRLQIKFVRALNFFFKAPAAIAAAAGESRRVPAPLLPVPPPGAGAAVRGRVSPPPAGRAWCWVPGPPRLSRGAQVSSALPRGGRGAAAGLRAAPVPRAGRRAGGAGAASGRALLTAGRRRRGVGPPDWERAGALAAAGLKGQSAASVCLCRRPHGLARARRRGGAAGRIVQKETEPKVTSPPGPGAAGLGRGPSDSSASGVRLGPESGGGEEWDSRLVANPPVAARRLGTASAPSEDFTCMGG